MLVAIQRTVLVLCAGVAFVMPFTATIDGLWTNFFMGFASGAIGASALRVAMSLGEKDEEENG